MTRLAAAFAALLLIAVACTDTTATPSPSTDAATPSPAASSPEAQSGPNIIPLLVSSEIAQGPNRFLFSLTDRENQLVAAPDVDVHLRFYDEDADPEAVVFEAGSRFIWAIEGVNGLYAADVTFPRAGRWATRFDATFADGTSETVRAVYDVRETTSTPAIGAAAPSVDTPIAEDVDGDLRRISTDPEPLATMYEVSIAGALDASEAFVVAFATPAFCRTATCGPTLETVKAVAAEHTDIRFIHVEPYILAMGQDSLQPVLSEEGQLQVTPWTEAWGLLTEPFVAVVGEDGTVRAKFEGTIAAAELEDAIAALDLATTATGIVIDVQQASLGQVESFTLRTEDGETREFSVGEIQLDDGAFPVDHLREHMGLAQPVAVTFREENGKLVAARLEDAIGSGQ